MLSIKECHPELPFEVGDRIAHRRRRPLQPPPRRGETAGFDDRQKDAELIKAAQTWPPHFEILKRYMRHFKTFQSCGEWLVASTKTHKARMAFEAEVREMTAGTSYVAALGRLLIAVIFLFSGAARSSRRLCAAAACTAGFSLRWRNLINQVRLRHRGSFSMVGAYNCAI